MNIINVSGYAFFDLHADSLPELKESLKNHCRALGLKGSILIAEEGANIFLAGTREMIDTISDDLVKRFGFPSIAFKESLTGYQPFRKMLVKIKKEIISMGCPEIKPSQQPAPYLSAKELKAWYDEGKDFILMDTRNDYEYELGTFKNAMTFDIDHFRAFPEVVREMAEDMKEKTIVTVCTGGIRCEKAAPFMVAQGFKNIYQLDGGILKYFEECGNEHYDGECFVFDQRVALNGALEETGTVQCFACRMPVTPEEQQNPAYQIEKSCPSCIDKRQD